jgi:hypothetical protein
MNIQNNNYLEYIVNIFDKAIVICQPKVGSRFFLYLSNYPKTINETYNQYRIDLIEGIGDDRLKFNTLFNKFNAVIDFLPDHKNTCFDYDSFFHNNNVKNINDFFLENPKDVYFVIRNPITRFLSAIPQIVSAYVPDLILDPTERDRIKLLGNISDSEIDNIYSNYDDYFNEYDEFSEKNLSKIDINIFIKIVIYILNYKSELYYYDNHTKPYLHTYKDLIYNIKDKNKVKIIDLEDCSKKSSYELFNSWSGCIDYTEAYYNKKGHQISNKKLYNSINFILTDRDIIYQSPYNFLFDEINHYNELKNSKYFIKL